MINSESPGEIERATMTRPECAAYLGVSVTTLDRMIKNREIEAVRLRHAVRITRHAADAALAGLKPPRIAKPTARARREFARLEAEAEAARAAELAAQPPPPPPLRPTTRAEYGPEQ